MNFGPYRFKRPASGRLRRGGLIATSLLCLAACSTPPVAVNPSEEGVVIRYGYATSSAAAAAALAQEVCAKYGRNAVFQGSDTEGDVFASYYCIKPKQPGTPPTVP
jgi:hypothetical protein